MAEEIMKTKTPEKSERELPKYCYARGRKIWFRYQDESGGWVNKSSKFTVDQAEAAGRYIKALLRGIELKVSGVLVTPTMTLREYVEQWIKDREQRDVASIVDERNRLRRYVLPRLGALQLEEVRPRHVRDLIRHLKVTKRKGKDGTEKAPLAPRTIHHIYNDLHNVFETAIVDEVLVTANPVRVKQNEMPAKVDADPEWRGLATYTTREVETLITSVLIPVIRRVSYALKSVAGLRHGEAAALCVRHLDFDAVPLGRIRVVQAFSTRHSKIKSTKTEVTRDVPMHPVLQKILKAWLEDHWPRVYGRRPTPDDFVIPTLTFRCISSKDANDAFKLDLRAHGLRVPAGSRRARGGHDLRSWYETNCIEDGADSLLLRRTTHAKPKDVSGGYERFSWKSLCREVAKLQLNVPDDQILKLGTVSLQAELKAQNRWRKMVTPSGLEPTPGGRSDGHTSARSSGESDRGTHTSEHSRNEPV
ncbi:MAG: tyrosine-type recombinase/integrase, partial [Kofleriaceae bacterium]